MLTPMEGNAETLSLNVGHSDLISENRLPAKPPVMRLSGLERSIAAVSQKMLIQQLRCLEHDGLVQRTIHPQVPPKVEYQLTSLGEAPRPTLRALLDWANPQETAEFGLVLIEALLLPGRSIPGESHLRQSRLGALWTRPPRSRSNFSGKALESVGGCVRRLFQQTVSENTPPPW